MKATHTQMDFLCKVIPDGYQVVPDAALNVLLEYPEAYKAFTYEICPGGFSWDDWERLHPDSEYWNREIAAQEEDQ